MTASQVVQERGAAQHLSVSGPGWMNVGGHVSAYMQALMSSMRRVQMSDLATPGDAEDRGQFGS